MADLGHTNNVEYEITTGLAGPANVNASGARGNSKVVLEKIVVHQFTAGTALSTIRVVDNLTTPLYDKTFNLAFAAAAVAGNPIVIELGKDMDGLRAIKVQGAGATLQCHLIYRIVDTPFTKAYPQPNY